MTAHSVAFRPRGDIDSASPVSRLLTPFEMAKGLMVIDRLNSTLDEPFKSLHLHQLKSSHRIQDNDILQEALKTLPFKTRRRPTRVHRAIGFWGASEIVRYLARVQPACIGQGKAQRTT